MFSGLYCPSGKSEQAQKETVFTFTVLSFFYLKNIVTEHQTAVT
jgi:hypothetical protein